MLASRLDNQVYLAVASANGKGCSPSLGRASRTIIPPSRHFFLGEESSRIFSAKYRLSSIIPLARERQRLSLLGRPLAAAAPPPQHDDRVRAPQSSIKSPLYIFIGLIAGLRALGTDLPQVPAPVRVRGHARGLTLLRRPRRRLHAVPPSRRPVRPV